MTKESLNKPSQVQNFVIIRSLVFLLLIGASIYMGAVFWFGWRQVVFVFSQLGISVLAVGGVVASLAYVLRFLRWDYLLDQFGYRVPWRNNLGVYLAGLALTASPGKLGETIRSVLLLPFGVKVQHSLATFLADRLSDVLGVCLLGMLAGFWVGQSIVLLTSIFITIFFSSYLLRLAMTTKLGRRYWFWGIRKIRWLPLRNGQVILKSWARSWSLGRMFIFTLIAVFAYGIQALVFSWYCTLVGLTLSIASAVFIFINATLFGAASMIPGGLGAMETALVLQLVAQGVDQGLALSVSLATRLVTFWLGLLLGCISLYITTRSLKGDALSLSDPDCNR